MDDEYVNHSIESSCIAGASDIGAAIDRLIRYIQSLDVYESSYSSPIHKLLTACMGIHISPIDIENRKAVVNTKYKVQLQNLLTNCGITQRTPEWYQVREVMITASDFAQALGFSKFGNQRDFFQKKCGHTPPKPFDDGVPPLRWGVMFEPVACEIYEQLNCGVRVHEFGLLRHPTHSFLGASPDGITEDGVMLEIKCPWRRRINGTVPTQYYFQIQGQLSVCNLDECDYFEVEFEELRAEDEILNEFTVVEDETTLATSKFPNRGVIIEILKTNPLTAEVSRKYKYPPKGMVRTYEKMQEFVIEEGVNKLQENEVHKVVWWRVRRHNTIKVSLDQEFVNDMIKRLTDVWHMVQQFKIDENAYNMYMNNTIKATKKNQGKKKIIDKDHRNVASSVPVYAFIDDPNEDI